MFTETKALEEALLRHFIHQKLEIAYAIHKPFPFFEGLRDQSFITDRMYKASVEACRNLVPVARVVHKTLTNLERMFDPSLLVALFSSTNLREYPNLLTILRSFRSVGDAYGGWNRAMSILSAAPADPTEGSSNIWPSIQDLLPRPPILPPPSNHPPFALRVIQHKASIRQSSETLGEPSSLSGPAVAIPGSIKEERITPVANDNLTSKTNDDDSQEMPHSLPGPVQGEKIKSALSTSKKRHQKRALPRGAASSEHGIQEKLQVVDQVTQVKDDSTSHSKVMTRFQKAKRECAQTPKPVEISDDTSEMKKVKRPKEAPSTSPRIRHEKRRKGCSWSSPERRQKKRLPRGPVSYTRGIPEKLQMVDQVTQMKDDSTNHSKVMTRVQEAKCGCAQTPEAEVSERPEDELGGLHSPELPVTCGEAKGILYKEKMAQGPSEKCIQNEEGAWFTPREFEVAGNRAQSKNWKRSVLCRGQTLGQLLEKGPLLCPSEAALKRESDVSDECEVCCRGGQLLCCDTCSRFFHETCHIPPAEAKRTPWSCTFCRVKDSSGSRQCHQESGILERRMRPADQLKCEFLLLKAYCHPQSSFFADTPRNLRDYAEPFREAMWLDLVKERMLQKMYTVPWFVRDMRLIFCNHKTFYKTSHLSQVGLDLEAEFENNLKEVFSFHEANENSFLAPP